jgi:RHS repeat-associated protein
MISMLTYAKNLVGLLRYSFRLALLLTLLSVCAGAQLNNTTATDGQTPLAMAPGAPAGSYALSGFDNVNLYNGNLNFRLPIKTVVGRGNAQMAITLPIETHWRVLHFFGPPCTNCNPIDNYIPIYGGGWSPLTPGYGPGVLVGRRAGKDKDCGTFNTRQIAYTLTRLTFIAPDGTEYELRDQLTEGKPHDFSSTACSGATPNFARGSVFATADGTAMTFIADANHPITDGFGFPEIVYPWGYLMLRDGTRMRIEDGVVKWLRDRNGNQLVFEYDQFKSLTKITDSLMRTVTIIPSDPQNGRFYEEIVFKGTQGAARSIQVWTTSLHNALRSGTAQGSSGFTIKTTQQLFPELNGADPFLQNDPAVYSKVRLPDGREYRFFYNSYGQISRVELPTGGAYEYDYIAASGVVTIFPPPGESGAVDYQVHRRVTERRVYSDPQGLILDNKTTYGATETNQVYPDPSFTTVDVNAYNGGGTRLMHEKHYFHDTPTKSFARDAIAYAPYLAGKEYLTEAYDNNENLLRKTESQFAQREAVSWWSTWPFGGISYFEPPNDTRLVEVTTTLADTAPVLVTKQTFDYDRYNNRKDTYEYDFGQNSPPALPTRHTHTNYVTTNPVNGINYATNTGIHIRSLVKDQTVYEVNPSNGSEATAAQTLFEYDLYNSSSNHAPLISRSSISGLDSAFNISYTTRGNLTALTRVSDVTLGTTLSIYHQYDVAGNIVKTVDARNNATTYDLSDKFGSPDGEAQSNSSPPELSALAQSSFAFVTSVSNPLSHVTRLQYDYNIGGAVDAEDENGIVTTGFYNDLLDRPTRTIRANNTSPAAGVRSQTTFLYDDLNRTITTSSDLNTDGDNLLKSVVIYDGLGRQIESRAYETTTDYIITQQNYDGLGRVRQVSNPYRPGDPIQLTTTNYDFLGRVITLTTPDQAQMMTSYSGNITTITDQDTKKRRVVKDGLGRLKQAVEDPLGQNLVTNYSFNALDKLTGVTQGVQSRSYSYDSLGRLKQAAIAEQVGSTSYTYDNNSNLQIRIDPNGVTTVYGYDLLNRVTSRTYQNDPQNTPPVSYTYDDPLVPFSKGELTKVSSSVSTSIYDTYDQLGRIKHSIQRIEGNDYAFSYNYNLAGLISSETYPSLRVVTTAYDAAGRITGLTGAKSGELVKPYASLMTYAPHGELTSMKLNNGLWEHATPNSRLQVKEIGLGTFNGDLSKLKIELDYGLTNNNGNLQNQKTTVDGTLIRQDYGYDGLNRLTSVQETTNGAPRWTQAYGYDRYANRTTLTNSGPEAALLPTQSTPPIITASNRISGYTYDNNGNVRIDSAGNTFTYDAENRQIAQTGINGASTYSYDEDSLRVKKVTQGVTTIYVYDAMDHLAAEYTSPDQSPQGGGGTSYYTTDHLGSTRVVTDGNGSVKSRRDYLPFGEELQPGIGGRAVAMKYGAADGVKQRFTSKQRDVESGLDYFGSRYYASSQGRFTGVDPLMSSAELGMPQTWNRYAYVLNNPLVIVDPNGEGWVWIDGKAGWDASINSQKDLDDNPYYKKRGAKFIPYGYIGTIVGGRFDGRQVLLGVGGAMILMKPQAKEIKEIEWYGGDGEKFLYAYFKFAVENAVLGFVGAKAVDAVEALVALARAKRAGKAAVELLEAAQKQGVCFEGGTSVATSEGDKPIEEIKEGDLVLSGDPICEESSYERVIKVFVRTARDVLDIRVGGVKISCTSEHPFWVEGEGWKAARELKPGTRLLTKNGKAARVERVGERKGEYKVYNLHVERLHSYYVSELGVLAHNQICAAGGGGAGSWKSVKEFGHTFNTHGQGPKVTRSLIGRAGQSGQAQGQWLNNEAAANFLRQFDGLLSGPAGVNLPKGLGQVIKPNGSIVPATRAILIPKGGGGFRTAFPVE